VSSCASHQSFSQALTSNFITLEASNSQQLVTGFNFLLLPTKYPMEETPYKFGNHCCVGLGK
jgi:hypothetical protein